MIQRSSLAKLAPGDLFLLHDPTDRPRKRLYVMQRGYHWSVWRKVHDPDHYRIVVDWRGDYEEPPEGDPVTTFSTNLIVISTDQTLCNALMMAAMHLGDGVRWHALLDRKFPWEEIDARAF